MALLEMSKTIDEHKSNTVEVVRGRQEKISDAVDAERLDWSSFHQYDRRGNVYHHHTHQFDAEQMYTRRRDEQMIASFKEHNIYEGLALSEAFLASYYSNVSITFIQLKLVYGLISSLVQTRRFETIFNSFSKLVEI